MGKSKSLLLSCVPVLAVGCGGAWSWVPILIDLGFVCSAGNKKSKARGAAGDVDLLDSSDADSVGSSSTALSDLSISYATENVNSHEFVLDKYIDALYEKRWTFRSYHFFILLSITSDLQAAVYVQYIL